MSLATNVTNLATRVASEAKALRTLINGNTADLSGLTTTAKTNLVAAINEIAAAVGSAGAAIDDASTSSLSVWSSSKTNTSINSAVAAVVAASPATLDTLNELAAALANDPNFATTITAALGGKEPLITGGTTAQYWRGDKSFQTLDKAAVGLSAVDNTSDVNKPVSGPQATALAPKAPLASPTFTGTVNGVTKAMVGLSAVDNTSDANKPVSTAQQTALNLKADNTAVGDTTTDYVATFNAGLV